MYVPTNKTHRPSETVQMVFFMIFVLISHVYSINLLNSVVKIVANLLFKSIHQLGAICYLYTSCCHLNITMFSDTQANYCFGRSRRILILFSIFI